MLEKFYRFSEATGICITLLGDGTTEISACSITINQDQLSLEKKIIDLQDIEELLGRIPVKAVVSVNLSGKGVLLKQIDKTEEISRDNFSKILPNANIDDFYIQNFISGNKSFVGVIRKTEADKWINHLQIIGYIPLMLSLGAFPVQNIINQLNVFGDEFKFAGHHVIRNERTEWESYQYSASVSAPFPLKIDAENIPEKLLLAYAAAFQLALSDKINLINAEVPELAAGLEKQHQDKKFKVQGFLILAIFFTLLLVNFCLFCWLNTSNAKLSQKVSKSVQSTDDVQKINEQVQQKESVLKNLGYEGAVNKSVLVDQIAALLPVEVVLKEVSVDPLDINNSRIEKSLKFFNKKIIVSGNSDKIIPINEWIARIKTKAWVKNVTLESYLINSEINTGQFTIYVDY